MATQILYARTYRGKAIEFGNLDDAVVLTDALDEICDSYFEEKKYKEKGEDEAVEYNVISFNKINQLNADVTKKQIEIINILKDVRGDKKRSELLEVLRDCSKMQELIIKMLLQDCKDSVKLLALL